MKRRAVFFDRDNTLIACDEFIGEPAKVVLVDGAADAVARARDLGYATITISNQSGVARGYFTEEAVHAVNNRLDELLADANPKAVIDRHEFCPYHPDASIEKYRQESELRKPKPGMILCAADALALDLGNSWVIGDAPRDIEAGKAAGCRAILFQHPELRRSPAADVHSEAQPDYVVSSLAEAMDFIERNTYRTAEPDPPVHPEIRGLPSAALKEEVESKPAEVPAVSLDKLETIADEILRELKRSREDVHADFSVSKLFAGIVQIIVLAVLFVALLNRNEPVVLAILIFALTLQAMTIALLIMARQK